MLVWRPGMRKETTAPASPCEVYIWQYTCDDLTCFYHTYRLRMDRNVATLRFSRQGKVPYLAWIGLGSSIQPPLVIHIVYGRNTQYGKLSNRLQDSDLH